jgi:hypothetical protein
MSVFTEQEQELVDKLLRSLSDLPKTIADLRRWISCMEALEKNIMSFPSLFSKPVSFPNKAIFCEQRSQLTLLDSLLVNREGDKILYLPARAMLGKGFLIAKYHMFNLFVQAAIDSGMPEADIKSLKSMTATLIFTLMAEDVYLNMLDDIATPESVRRQVALALLLLWEHRSDFIIAKDHMSALQAVWDARNHLAPVFGSMMGMSELMQISMDLDAVWAKFITEKLSDNEILLAMEEFLMGLSFEQIQILRKKLREQGLTAVNRDEVKNLLKEDVPAGANIDLDDFYMMYTIRRDNARARKRLHHKGPQNTLEDHYMAFVFEEYRKTDFSGIDVL